jgi:hypothetical protein
LRAYYIPCETYNSSGHNSKTPEVTGFLDKKNRFFFNGWLTAAMARQEKEAGIAIEVTANNGKSTTEGGGYLFYNPKNSPVR